jgi:hypothetical protein
MSNTETHKEERCGIIRVASEILSQLVPEITTDLCDTQGKLREQGLFQKAHEKLLLPASYTVLGIFTERYGRGWAIVVESPELPVALEGEEYPTVEPTYACTYSDDNTRKNVCLAKMTVYMSGGIKTLVAL